MKLGHRVSIVHRRMVRCFILGRCTLGSGCCRSAFPAFFEGKAYPTQALSALSSFPSSTDGLGLVLPKPPVLIVHANLRTKVCFGAR